MHIGEIVVHRVIDRIGRYDVIVAGWVIPILEPPHIAEQRIEDDLLHLRLGVHLLQGGVGYPLQDVGGKLLARLLHMEKDMWIIIADRGDDLTRQWVKARHPHRLVGREALDIEVKLIRLEEPPPNLMARPHP